jgi:thiol-disulfide isomerase/thioredoxin
MIKKAAVLTALFVSAVAWAAPISAPKVTSALPKTLPLPYDESADAHAQLNGAIAAAKPGHKYVLLDFGGNWCPDCRVMAGVLGLPEVAPAIKRDFQFVAIDVGRFNKNLDIPAAYGVKITAVPTVIILDDNGKFVNAGNPTALSDARNMSPQAIVDTIYGWIGAAAH